MKSDKLILAIIIVVMVIALPFSAKLGHDSGYDAGLKEGTTFKVVNFDSPPMDYTSDVDEYREPVDIGVVLIEKLIAAMSSAKADLVFENGEIISGEIHIEWERDKE